MTRAGAGAAAVALALSACAAPEGARPLDYGDLDGWAGADPAPAREALARHCGARPEACPAALFEGPARAAVETAFRPMLLPGASEALLTGYYEPVLAAAAAPSEAYPVPVHGLPSDPDALAATRAEIARGALEGRAPVLYWLADPVDRFFLQVQGSGRLQLADGRRVRVGYAGRNAHSYRSIGRIAVARGDLAREGLTAERLKAWLRAEPARGRALMDENPSYIFFRDVTDLAEADGPVGAAGLPLRAGVSAAFDPEVYPPGSLVWIAADGPGGPVRRLVVAEDTGSAIRGPGRADLFLGTGAEAGRVAGALLARGRLVLLAPRGAMQAALASEAPG